MPSTYYPTTYTSCFFYISLKQKYNGKSKEIVLLYTYLIFQLFVRNNLWPVKLSRFENVDGKVCTESFPRLWIEYLRHHIISRANINSLYALTWVEKDSAQKSNNLNLISSKAFTSLIENTWMCNWYWNKNIQIIRNIMRSMFKLLISHIHSIFLQT